MPVPVFARPDELRRLRAHAGAAADGLVVRAGALERAVAAYRPVTEPGYEAACTSAATAVAAFGHALRSLGDWVGRVGDAFAVLPGRGGRHITTLERLSGGLPVTLRLGVEPLGAGALTLASAVPDSPHPRDLRAVAELVGAVPGAGAAAGRAVDASRSPLVGTVGRYLDWGTAMARGATESEARWRSETHLDVPERGARAFLDGALATAGTYGGGAAGAAAAAWACTPFSPPVQAVCAASGARAGAAVGGAVAEIASDAILGPEPPRVVSYPWEVVSGVVGAGPGLAPATEALLRSSGAPASAAAQQHAEFVLERPWLWDDEFADAPSHPAPSAPPPPAAVAGPR